MSLKGSPELRARLRAIRQTFKPIGRKWADATAKSARRRVPVKTGRLQKSIRVRNATQRKATVVGHYTGNFVNAGTVAHLERPKKRKALAYGARVQGPVFGGSLGSAPVFAKKVNHPRTKAQPFKVAAARDGLRENPMAVELIRQWNEAAR